MNKAHRIIWSHARQAFVVADEHASSQGKRNGTRLLLAAMGAGLLAGAAPALAVPTIPDGSATDNNAEYAVPSDGYLIVEENVSVSNTSSAPVIGTTGSFEFIINKGSISTTSGNAVLLAPDTTAGTGRLIYNKNDALIEGATSALRLETSKTASQSTSDDNSLVVNEIKNAGTIQSTEKGSKALYLRNNVKVGGVTNSGDFKAMAEQSNSEVGSVAIRLEGGAEITGKLVNTWKGDIKANYDTGTGILVTGDSKIVGGIENNGEIKGGTGIVLQGSDAKTPVVGGIDNNWRGKIEGKSGSAIVLNQALVSGKIENSGEIEGQKSGIEATDSRVEGLISNKWNGEITGKTVHGISLTEDSSAAGLKNSYKATIKGGVDGVHLSESSLYTPADDDSKAFGDIDNAGTIQGRTGAGIRLESSEIGNIENSGLIGDSKYSWHRDGVDGIHASKSTIAAIDNSGTIRGSKGAGILLDEKTQVTDGIYNEGQITGKTAGIALNDSTTKAIDNDEGSIESSRGAAISLENGASLSGLAGDEINDASPNQGFSIINYLGKISGKIAGIALNNSTSTAILNMGDIRSSDGSAIKLENGGKITGVEVGSDENLMSIAIANGAISEEGRGEISGKYAGISLDGSSIDGSIVNAGDIESSRGSAIRLDGASTLTGDIVNLVEGKISGKEAGINLDNASSITGAIVNGGRIESSRDSAISLTNSEITGIQEGGLEGVAIYNSGKIKGDESGIRVKASTLGGDILNTATGWIKGEDGSAIRLKDSTVGGIENYGTIKSDDRSGISASNSTIASITNYLGGKIFGKKSAIALSGAHADADGVTIAGNIINEGKLESRKEATISLDNAAKIDGAIVNMDTGKIESSRDSAISLTNSEITGIQEVGLEGVAIYNSGKIKGGESGIRVEASTLGGAIHNTATGLIKGDEGSAIRLKDSTVSAIENSGRILSEERSGISASDSTLTSITNYLGGMIFGKKSAIALSGTAEGDDSVTVAGDITNLGTLMSSRDAAISLSDAKIGGAIVNTDKIESFRDSAISLTGSEITGIQEGKLEGVAIYNSGKIKGDESGIYAKDSTIHGDIINHGGIKGEDGSAIRLQNSTAGAIENSGWIWSEERSGISASYSSIESLTNSGYISGKKSAIALSGAHTDANGVTVAGDITNAGTLKSSRDAALSLEEAKVDGAIINTGKIESSRDSAISLKGDSEIAGADLNFSDGDKAVVLEGVAIYNSGKIKGDESGIYAKGSAINGDIINAKGGKIKGDDSGIYAKNSTIGGDILNAGTIESRKGTGIELKNTEVTGKLVNSGTIEGKKYAIKLSGSSEITGGIDIIGTKARLDGDVKASGTDFTLKSGAKFSNEHAYDVKSFTIEQGATLFMGKGRALSHSLDNGIKVSDGFHNKGVLDLGSEKEKVVRATIDGDYTQSKNATLRVYIDTDKVVPGVGDAPKDYSKAYSKLNVTGTATLAKNANIDVDVSSPDYSFTTNRLAGVLTADSIVANGFNVTDNSYLFNFGAELVKGMERDQVDLTIFAIGGQAIEASTVARSNNPGRNAARVLDRVLAESEVGAHAAGKLAGKFIGFTNQQQVSDAVSQTLPLLTGASQAAASGAMAGTNRVIQARLDSNSGLSSGDSALTDGNLWIKPFGSRIEQDDRKGVSGYEADVLGFAIGADAPVSENLRLGLAVAYANASIDGNSRIAPQSADVDTLQLIGYGSYKLSNSTELNFQADIGQNSTDGRRHILFDNSTAKSSYDSITAHVGLGLGHTLTFSDTLTFVPSVRADYTWIQDEAYREKGADVLNLHVDKRNTDELILSTDGKLNYALTPATVLSANLGLGYDLLNETTQITAAYAGASGLSFTTEGLDASSWMARGGLGLTHSLDNGTEIGLRYDVESRSGFDNQSASLKVRYNF